MLLTETVESTGAANAIEGGQKPQSEEDAGVVGIASGLSGDGVDGLEPGREIELFDVGPDDPSGVFGGQELVEGSAAHLDLSAFDRSETGRTGRSGTRRGRTWLGAVRTEGKEGGVGHESSRVREKGGSAAQA
jgi:hypothetical protein